MSMARFLTRRLFHSIFVIIGISMLIFVISRIVPGDPARMALGDNASQESVDKLREDMHLNEPIYTQYYYWIRGVLTGNFGFSLTTNRSVSDDVREFLPATLEIVIVAGVIQTSMAFVVGLLAARNRDNAVDGAIRMMSYIGVSVPSFVWAIFFLLFFGFTWQVLPVINRLSTGTLPPNRITGMYIIDFLLMGNFGGAWDAFQHVFLPGLSLSIAHIFSEGRVLRSSLIDNMSKEYISVATAYGTPKNKLFYKYMLKPSAISMVTMAGLDFATTLGNAFLVETIFNWPGLSRYGLTVMMNKDLNAISIVIIIIGLLFMISNIVVDVIIAALDPRVRLGE
ncbi:MAG: ABC transporter permease [Clostridiaceae bacterium]|nr:ABC transporter permease [Clostridiaceae bacterium]